MKVLRNCLDKAYLHFKSTFWTFFKEKHYFIFDFFVGFTLSVTFLNLNYYFIIIHRKVSRLSLTWMVLGKSGRSAIMEGPKERMVIRNGSRRSKTLKGPILG